MIILNILGFKKALKNKAIKIIKSSNYILKMQLQSIISVRSHWSGLVTTTTLCYPMDPVRVEIRLCNAYIIL